MPICTLSPFKLIILLRIAIWFVTILKGGSQLARGGAPPLNEITGAAVGNNYRS